MNHSQIMQLSTQLGAVLCEQQQIITTAESCTGGLLSSLITQIPGASAYFEQSWVTYSNQAKQLNLGVPLAILEQYGAVSIQTAEQMALGAIHRANATIAISITGIAGPDGGTPEKPVGTVCFGFAFKNKGMLKENTCMTEKVIFDGDREYIRFQACAHALKFIFDKLSKNC